MNRERASCLLGKCLPLSDIPSRFGLLSVFKPHFLHWLGVCVSVGCTLAKANVCGGQRTAWGSLLSFYHVGPWMELGPSGPVWVPLWEQPEVLGVLAYFTSVENILKVFSVFHVAEPSTQLCEERIWEPQRIVDSQWILPVTVACLCPLGAPRFPAPPPPLSKAHSPVEFSRESSVRFFRYWPSGSYVILSRKESESGWQVHVGYFNTSLLELKQGTGLRPFPERPLK